MRRYAQVLVAQSSASRDGGGTWERRTAAEQLGQLLGGQPLQAAELRRRRTQSRA